MYARVGNSIDESLMRTELGKSRAEKILKTKLIIRRFSIGPHRRTWDLY